MGEGAHNLLEGDGFEAHALFIGERIDVRHIAPRLATNPLVVDAGAGGYAVLFRYGVVVFFNVPQPTRAQFVAGLRPGVSKPYDEPEREAISFRVEGAGRDGVGESDAIVLQDSSIERLQVVADVLAKSVVLAQYEEELSDVFNSVEPLAGELTRGRGRRRTRDLLKHIGRTLLIQHKMVGRVEVLEKPELLWENPELERLYLRLEDEYELVERHKALERKLALINATATTALELVRARRTLRVEWYIVLLIVIEIALTLYEMFGPG